MRVLATVLLVLALAGGAFAYWGLNTAAGRSAFDEMAGIIPLAAGLVGLLCGCCALFLWWRA